MYSTPEAQNRVSARGVPEVNIEMEEANNDGNGPLFYFVEQKEYGQ